MEVPDRGGEARSGAGAPWRYLMEVESLSTLRYWRMSGMDIRRRTRRNLRPVYTKKGHSVHAGTSGLCTQRGVIVYVRGFIEHTEGFVGFLRMIGMGHA